MSYTDIQHVVKFSRLLVMNLLSFLQNLIWFYLVSVLSTYCHNQLVSISLASAYAKNYGLPANRTDVNSGRTLFLFSSPEKFILY